jgi:DNA adenine methylase
MKYMGSKARHAKELLPIILKDHAPDMWYVEPFVGGANMIDKVCKERAPKRIGFDVNKYLIAMWNDAISGKLDYSYVDKELYTHVRENKDSYPDGLVGWVAHCCSYNGKWFGGFAGEITTKEGNKRNYQTEAANAVKKQVELLKGCYFKHKSVFDIILPSKSTIYCDPPYKDTTKYKDDFDHEKFYDWCRDRKKDGHTVFVSEYWMPDDFTCMWEKKVNSGLNKDVGSKQAVERLFTL